MELFGWSTLPVERRRLIAATAEPFDSFSARVVSSSRISASQHNSHTWASRDRPRAILGGRELVRVEMGGRVIMPGRAL